AGMQSLVVVAAMPRVLRDLGGVEFYGTVFSGYFLSGLVSIPLAGRAADREGPTRPFVRMMLCFALGTVLCSLAPSMPLLALARVIQGYGGGAVYTIAYGVIAKAYPSQARPRMLVVLTMTWVVSGLVAPSVGAILATTVGWRWVFVVVLPLVLLAAAAAGALVAMQRLMPRGWLRAAAGAPAAVALNLLLYLGFFTADSFITLLLTDVRGVSVAEAGVAVTLVSISWSLASWWQSKAITRYAPSLLTLGGSAVFVAGTACVLSLLAGAPLWLGYAGWTVAGA